ncbi:histone-lysine N-methyltransferase trithorax [Culicoides brevitarsis]|uniref:histone-lysine N-methyltransferase trithorax n=1 Tax=Culicoides brevitarsis TaxID=469753 RepID=UPI00307B564A
MGKSKFPGKPSKLAGKKKIRILSRDEAPATPPSQPQQNGAIVAATAAAAAATTNGSNSPNFLEQDKVKPIGNNDGNEESSYEESIKSDDNTSSSSSTATSVDNNKAAATKAVTISTNAATTSAATTTTTATSSITAETGSSSKTMKSVRIANTSDEVSETNQEKQVKINKKKSVSFKATLETSDDKNIVKKVYNPDNNAPLVPIIKRRFTCIVRPSRLTDVLQKNNESSGSLAKAASLFSAVHTSSDVNERAAAGLRQESPKKGLYSCRIIKSNKRLLGYPRELLKKIKNGKLLKINQYLNSGEHLDGIEDGGVDSGDADSERNQQKVILRQPRLKFTTGSSLTPNLLDIPAGPFSFGSIGSSNNGSISIFDQTNASLFRTSSTTTPATTTSSSSSTTAFGLCNNNSSNLNSHLCAVCKVQTTSSSQISKKFGVYNCEACRKFISKMLKKGTSSSSSSSTSSSSRVQPVSCIRGDGNCNITYEKGKDRCSACMLKSCLRTYTKLPLKFRHRIHLLLPHSLRAQDKAQLDGCQKKSKSESSNLFATAVHSNKILVGDKEEEESATTTTTTPVAATTSFSNAKKSISKISLPNPLAENNSKFGSQLTIKPNIGGIDKPSIMSPKVLKEATENQETKKEESVTTTKSKQKSEESTSSAPKAPPATTDRQDKRQKIMLKGPRVKHVCRSASIALGQPLATFGDEPEDEERGLLDAQKQDTDENLSGKENKTPEHESEASSRPNSVTPASEMSLDINIGESQTSDMSEQRLKEIELKLSSESKPATRKYQIRPIPGGSNISSNIHRNLNVFMKRQLPSMAKGPSLVSIDFWENYDPAEVSRSGFGIIATESFSLQPLCFLCGSAGNDPMLYCTCCCEPYHLYCIDDVYNNKSFTEQVRSTKDGDSTVSRTAGLSSLKSRLNWLCPRCTCCYTCNMTAGPKVRCQKCEKFFHSTCLGISKRLHRTDRPSICSSCLKCKSCSSTNVSKFVGNLPHCINCFKLRQKGNFCPVCQKCYENDNLELKMMECGSCKRWIHAKCESLTDEQYNMLSVLPEHIEFICRRCSKDNPTEAVLWRDAVTTEFNACLLSVIKLLSKSREACALLKLSPRKKNYVPCAACQQNLQSNRAIEFATGDDDTNEETTLFSGNEKKVKGECTCAEQQVPDTGNISLLDVKQKIAKQLYHSLHEFHYDMNLILQSVDSSELGVIYKEILSEIFPWFQNETKACTDALEESMYDANSYDMNASDEESLERQVPSMFDVRNEICLEDFWSRNDARCCVLCRGKGEDEGRFIFCGQNTWIHVNCALYSAEVFEEIDGSLQNVQSAINRGRLIKCSVCGNKGATVGCNVKNCGEHYHFPCAKQAECLFLNNQTTLCPLHKGEASGSELLDLDSLNPNRPIYVEIDRKKKKMADPSKIRFYLGSLSIEKLGRIVPSLSDSADAIVPTDFQCVRMYWSTQEPWKIVKYSIKTSILTANGCGFDNGKNFTIDHSRDPATVQANLGEISKWHLSLNQDEETSQFTSPVEETNDEEPQNNADLLPPEIKDAIFEDLPHDMLNSISMLDIFSPKLMTEEYPLTMTDVEQLKDSIYNDSNDSFRFEEFGTNGSSSSLDFIEESLLRSGHNSKRTKSELLRANYVNSINSKKRKLTHKLQEIMMPMKSKKEDESLFGRLKISQLDGSFDLNPKRRKRKVIGKLRKKNLTLDFKISQLDGIDDQVMTQLMPSMENPVSCERCRCTYRTQESYERHLPGCDVVSTSDSEPESPRMLMDGQQVQQQQASDQVQTFSLNSFAAQGNAFPQLTIDPTTNAITVGANYAVSRTSQQSMASMPVNLQSTMGNMANVILAPNHQQIPTVQMNGFQQQLSLPFQALSQLGANVITSSPFMQTQTTTTTAQQVQQRPEYEASKTQQIVQQAIVQNNLATQGNKILIPANRKHALPRLGNAQIKSKAAAIKPAIKKDQQNAVQIINSLPLMQTTPQQATQIVPYQQPLMLQTNNGLSNNLVQYIDNQNMVQYMALPQDIKTQAATPQYLTTTPNTFLGGAFQMAVPQPQATDQNILVSNGQGGYSVIPLSAIQPQQTQILGTLVQPQATAMQMGVMSSEQMIMGGMGAPTSTLEMVQDPTSGLMYLASQPVYYGLETIVQNTVMSSQQFVSTAMQSVCQNASFSATTTQVFQTSKIEPIVEVPPGYVMINNDNGQSIMPAGTPQAIQQATYVQSIAPAPTQQAIQAAPVVKIEEKESKLEEIEHHQAPPAKPALLSPKGKNVTIQKAKAIRPITTNHAKLQNISAVKPKIIAKPVVKQQPEIVVKPPQVHQQQIQHHQPPPPQEIKIITPESCMMEENQAMNFGKLNMNLETNPPAFITAVCDTTTTTTTSQKPSYEPTVYFDTTTSAQSTVLQQQQQQPRQETYSFNQQQQQQSTPQQQQQQYHAPPASIVLPTTAAPSIPTNIVSPIQQTVMTNPSTRPTNRVLPMQTFVEKSPEKIQSETEEQLCDISDYVKENNNKLGRETYDCQLENEFNSTKMMENDEKVTETINKLVSAIDENIFMDMQTSENKKQQMVEEVCNTIQNEIMAAEKSPMQEKVVDAFDLLRTQPDEIHPIPIRHISQHHQSPAHQIQQSPVHQMQQSPHQIHQSPHQMHSSPVQQHHEPSPSHHSVCEEIPMQIDHEPLIPQNVVEDAEQMMFDSTSASQKENIENIQPTVEVLKENASNMEIIPNIKTDVLPLKPLQPQQNILRTTTPKILFEINSQDGFSYKSTSISEVWEKVFESVQHARKSHGLKALPDGPLSEIGGLNMLGLRTNAIRYLAEQLPGAEKCTKYQFKYHKNRPSEACDLNVTGSEYEEMRENKHEVARFIPYSTRSEYDMFSWLASRHRKQPTPVVVQNNDEIAIPRRGSGSNLPLAMRYRNLQKSPKDYVGVYRSGIHGRGLFCVRDIEAGEMVIEYAGELIRSTLTDKRERYYDSKGIGCYMFKIDDNFVVDATMRGNAARFINHSCDPNCYSKVVDILGHKHIIIFALRRIIQGEELTYDYKFPFEDDKIPCSCGAKKCRKYLN